MNMWNQIYLFAFLGGVILTLIDTPFFQWLAVKTNFMDKPQANHKGHQKATPLLGGAAMFTAWILLLIFGFLAISSGYFPYFSEVMLEHHAGILTASRSLLFIALGAFLSIMLGLVDDKWALTAAQKFSGQFIIALIAVYLGNVKINIFIDNSLITGLLTIFWIMLLMNSINFFDNMDGLAIGTVTIAMGFFTILAALNQQFFVATLAALTCGVGAGFWFYNFNPATIFMGDSGSHFIGYLAAVISASVTYFKFDSSHSRLSILLPLFILALPLFDTAMVVLIRTKNRKPFWIGDHNHISHRFVRMGLTRKQAVMLVHLMALGIGLGVLPIFWGDLRTAMILIAQAFILLLIITFLQFTLSNKPDARENPLPPAETPKEP